MSAGESVNTVPDLLTVRQKNKVDVSGIHFLELWPRVCGGRLELGRGSGPFRASLSLVLAEKSNDGSNGH